MINGRIGLTRKINIYTSVSKNKSNPFLYYIDIVIIKRLW